MSKSCGDPKTADRNDLKQPENEDLLSPTNRVRAIITKQALQEGWDCSFAYVLCALAASSNENAMTQLVGRILRQPDALKTGVPALDECHVVTHRADTARVVKVVKDGLEKDGLGDLVLRVNQNDTNGVTKIVRELPRRPEFASAEIYLPKVMIEEESEVRELDYETDILSILDWRGFEPDKIAKGIPDNAQAAEHQLQRIKLSDEGDELFVGEFVSQGRGVLAFDPAYTVRMVSDLLPNPFVAREVVGRLLNALRSRGFSEEKLGSFASLITSELRRGLDAARTERAESLFKAEVEAGRIQFRLRLDGQNWCIPDTMETTEPVNAPQLPNSTGGSLEKSLFTPVYQAELNNAEREVAVYLDGEKALTWWHRNVARQQYGIQGWKKAKIYPDFIFAVQTAGASTRITVLETKGDQLDNLDTAYKRDVLNFLSEHFAWDECTPAGQLELVKSTGDSVQGVLILMSEWKSKLPAFLKP